MSEKTMTSETVKWIIASIIDRAAETAKEYDGKKDDFAEGLMEGYYEVLDMIKSRLFVSGETLYDYGIDIDLEKLESILKKGR